MTEYALYKGENLLSIGTIKEIAEELNIKEATVRYYSYPVQKRRSSEAKGRRLIKLDDE